jgi:DNA-binding MarR family transcriptional regulator
MRLEIETELLGDYSSTDLLLLDYLRKETRTNQPSNSKIQKALKISVNTILKGLDRLQKGGYIKIDNPSKTVRMISIQKKGENIFGQEELDVEDEQIYSTLNAEDNDLYDTGSLSILLDDVMVQWSIKALHENLEMLIQNTFRDDMQAKRKGVTFSRVELLFERLELPMRVREKFDIDKKISR